MNRSLPSGRMGQLLAVAMTAVLPAVVIAGIAMPLVEWYGERAAALARQATLARRMEALAAALPALRQQEAAGSGLAGEPMLLDGDSDPTAGAALQVRLETMFTQAGLRLNSVETLPGEAAGAYRRIRLRIAFHAPWPALLGVLRDMHVATPALLVDDLQVQLALHRIGTVPGSFDVSCTVFSFRSGLSQAAVQ